ncbi:hypothetical protein L3X14_08200 [Pseudomonas balearica]|uniref:hypothetical protein n=1 Tax=Stutzerimonas balearica TaxID=74829 RepID=UPI001F3F173D|nr:hypothetical protein [Stutzerimonas balearica]MCF6756576.1 hypothetical protein [Stutzerimonas balearica]
MNGDEYVGDQRCVIVFTCRGKERMIKEGGSQAWRIDASRASKCKYVVCVQNRNETWGQASAPHKHAFLIAEISGIAPSEQSPGRQIIKFKQFADLDVPDCWDGNRNPVAYGRLADFGIQTLDDLEDLSFTRLGARLHFDVNLGEISESVDTEADISGDDYEAAALLNESEIRSGGGREESLSGLGFEEAKQQLALRYGVAPGQIEILIRG